MTNKNNDTSTCLRIPKLYLWNREVLFLGTCYARQQAHRTTQQKLMLCLNGTFTVRDDTGKPIATRSCLTGSGLWLDRSVVDTSKAVVAIFFLAPFSQDHGALSAIMKRASPGVHYQHPDEEALVRETIAVRNDPDVSAPDTRKRLRKIMFPESVRGASFEEFDHRIVLVAQRIRESLHRPLTLAEMADEIHLSGSRLEKLFKDQTGLPITPYRVRYRVFIATILMALGYSVTDSAMYAGFSSSAHLSRCYRTINGMTPSTVFLRPPFLNPLVDESALKLITPLIEGHAVV